MTATPRLVLSTTLLPLLLAAVPPADAEPTCVPLACAWTEDQPDPRVDYCRSSYYWHERRAVVVTAGPDPAAPLARVDIVNCRAHSNAALDVIAHVDAPEAGVDEDVTTRFAYGYRYACTLHVHALDRSAEVDTPPVGCVAPVWILR